ncbi:MAG: hypothetical protein IT489_02165 [Gammaproteobacteria bacterium]|nr:hypothetical protein [Gammaproteobacteria bacterium]
MIRIKHLLGIGLLAAALSACTALRPHENAPPSSAAETPQPQASMAAPPVEAVTRPEPEAVIQPAPSEASPAPESLQTSDLLRDAVRYDGLSPDERRAAIDEAGTRLDIEQTPQALVRFALLLSLSEPNRQTDADISARLRELFTQSPQTDDTDLVSLARILAHSLSERERLSTQNAELMRKLNQLKAIERQLGDRDGADMPPPAP